MNNLTKFNEYLQIKGYSKASAASSVRVVNFFEGWTATQNIYELTDVSYSDVLSFVGYLNERNVAKKTQVTYIKHLNHYYNFLRSEEGVKEKINLAKTAWHEWNSSKKETIVPACSTSDERARRQ